MRWDAYHFFHVMYNVMRSNTMYTLFAFDLVKLFKFAHVTTTSNSLLDHEQKEKWMNERMSENTLSCLNRKQTFHFRVDVQPISVHMWQWPLYNSFIPKV